MAIGLVGGVMAAAAAAGGRSGGRSALYQAVLAGFGWHAVGHVAQAVAVRGYAPGAVTAPVVVAPFSVWAWRRLLAGGVPANLGRSSAWGMALLPVTLGAVQLAGRRLTRRAPDDEHRLLSDALEQVEPADRLGIDYLWD